ncbi:MAG TPA: hypothetical protein VNL69_07570, partial [Bacteroidota bacterium]|nr:hypothetical protein [Bacteroidota bacterium]
MTLSSTHGQSLLSARSLALGAYGASVTDTRSFESNPAGIVGIRDWEFSTTTYTATSTGGGFVFQGLTIGKRLWGEAAMSLAYMPGSLLEFALPAIVITSDSGTPATIQQRISYRENLLLAGAYRFSPTFSIGVGARFRQTEINDTKYELLQQGSGYVSRITPRTEEASAAVIDLGVLFRPVPFLRIGLVGRNVLALQGDLPADVSLYQLPRNASLELSARVEPSAAVGVNLQASSLSTGGAGIEVAPLSDVKVRAGVFFSKDESPAVYAWSVGAGVRYEFLEIDAGYVGFPAGGTHTGRVSVGSFDASKLHALDLHPYAANRAMLTVKAMFGRIREPYVRILSVEMLDAIYPSSYEQFAFRPIGRARVKNISEKPVHVRARFFIEGFMDVPTESEPVTLQPGEENDLPFNAVLSPGVKSVTHLLVREADLYVNATASDEYDDRVQTRVVIR